jgi:xanthine/uracil permease
LHWHDYWVDNMTKRSRNLGIISVLLFSAIFLYRRAPNWLEPILFSSFALSAVFGILAARSGSNGGL